MKDLAEEILFQRSSLTEIQQQAIERIHVFNQLSKCNCCLRHQTRRPKDICDFRKEFVEIDHILEDGTICDFRKSGPKKCKMCSPRSHYICTTVGNWEDAPKLPHDQLMKDYNQCHCDCRHQMRSISLCITNEL